MAINRMHISLIGPGYSVAALQVSIIINPGVWDQIQSQFELKPILEA